MSDSDVQGVFLAEPGYDPPIPHDVPGSIDVDLLFVDPSYLDIPNYAVTIAANLRLDVGSPCIDAGDNAAAPPPQRHQPQFAPPR